MSPVPRAPRARPPEPDTTTPAPAHEAEARALEQALAGLMDAAARLAVAKGLPYAAVQDLLQQAFVDAASAAAAEAAPGLAPHRRVSRIATATGINRREVTRRVQARAAAAAAAGDANGAAAGGDGTARRGRALASEVYAHWRSQAPYRGAGRAGRPKVLPRVGPEPSFETLAQAITRDVHPRSLLDELLRLKLARWNEAEDTVELLGGDGFVPQGDRVKLLELLGDNVGDHLRAAVANVLHEDRRHFEQAVFATGLSGESLAGLRPLVAAQWAALLQTLVPHLEARIEADAPQKPRGRVRIGLFSYHEDTEPGEGPR
jgi:DNA-directed RNA polymerase specialized sigma24 family protein